MFTHFIFTLILRKDFRDDARVRASAVCVRIEVCWYPRYALPAQQND